jgi:RimJ/RimL family protein N-acetyltransferase
VDHRAAAPLLETERLRLRCHRAGDLENMLAMWCEPGVFRFIAGKPSTREDIWRGLLRHLGQWQVKGFGFWVLEHKATAAFVGEAGFLDCKRDVVPSMDETPEVGWALHPRFHGQGLATEAMTAILAWGDQNLDQPTTACIVSPENAPSIVLATKLGYKQIAATTYKNEATLMMQRQKQ